MENWKTIVLLKGENGIMLSDIKKKYKNLIDFKTFIFLILRIKKKPFHYNNRYQKHPKTFHFANRWEISRKNFLGDSLFNNPPLNEICSQILTKIFSFGQTGTFQHIIGSEIGLRTCDIHHHINYLIKVGLIVKKNVNIKSGSKLNNAIQLRCIIFETLGKRNIFSYNIQDYKDIEMTKSIIKILLRINYSIRQKDLKYGILCHQNPFNIEKRRLHRIWQKAKKKISKGEY